MIIPHQDNVAGFTGGHTYYWSFANPLLSQGIGVAPIVIVVIRQPVTTIITPSTVTTDTYVVIQEAVSKLLDSLGCQNIHTTDIPPITTEGQFVDLLQFKDANSKVGKYEAWFLGRRRLRTRSLERGTNQQYQQTHTLQIVGLAWHFSLEVSYDYMQDKVDRLVALLRKNINFLGGSQIDQLVNLQADFRFDQFGELGLYRGDLGFELDTTIQETIVRR